MIFPPLSCSTLQVKLGTCLFSIHYRGLLNEKSGPLCLHCRNGPLLLLVMGANKSHQDRFYTADENSSHRCTVTRNGSNQILYRLNQWGQCMKNFWGHSKESLMKTKWKCKSHKAMWGLIGAQWRWTERGGGLRRGGRKKLEGGSGCVCGGQRRPHSELVTPAVPWLGFL